MEILEKNNKSPISFDTTQWKEVNDGLVNTIYIVSELPFQSRRRLESLVVFNCRMNCFLTWVGRTWKSHDSHDIVYPYQSRWWRYCHKLYLNGTSSSLTLPFILLGTSQALTFFYFGSLGIELGTLTLKVKLRKFRNQ